MVWSTVLETTASTVELLLFTTEDTPLNSQTPFEAEAKPQCPSKAECSDSVQAGKGSRFASETTVSECQTQNWGVHCCARTEQMQSDPLFCILTDIETGSWRLLV